MLDAYWAATPFINARPCAPSFSDGEETFLSPMRDATSLWEKLNDDIAPAGITLPMHGTPSPTGLPKFSTS